MSAIAFYIISAVLVVSALVVVCRSVFTSALYLASALSMVAGIFVLLSADFLAAVQILLYVGGILIILAFAVMLSSVQLAKLQPQVNRQWLPALLMGAGLLAVVLAGLKRGAFQSNFAPAHGPTTEKIGHLLLGDMILPFELISLILLASLVGAVIFTKKESDEKTGAGS